MSEVEADKVDNLPFKWGTKRGVGGKKKEVKFYESFTYDGVDYTLYDCVYTYKEGEPGPYVGKLIKIWENANKTKKVKLHWFFQPYEIVNWLGNEEVSANEIFLASGEGVGLANINPLEAIAGKCNVVCISKDCRNRQPSAKELEMADYIFYRTFDVGHFSISDRLDDKVGGLEVKFVFNREDSEQPADIHDLGSIKKEDAEACKPALELLGKSSSAIVEVEGKDGGSSHLALKESENVKSPVIKSKISPRGESASDSPDDLNEVATASGRLETVPGEITPRNRDSQEDAEVKESVHVEDSLIKLKSSSKGKSAVGAPEASSRVIASNGRHEPVSGDKTKRSSVDSHKDDAKVSKAGRNQFCLEEPIKDAKEPDPYRPSKKSVVEDSVKPLENRNTNKSEKIVHENNTKASAAVSYEKKTKSEPGKDSLELGKGVRSTQNLAPSEERPSKKARVENSMKSNENKHSIGVQKCSTSGVGNNAKDSTATENSNSISVTAAERSKSKVASVQFENDSKQKIDEKRINMSNSQLTKVDGGHSRDADRKKGDTIKVSRRPDDERSKWFRELPWDERLKKAHEEGTLVLLSNLDPEYSSKEVEDIVWSIFTETCAAKRVQCSAISSPHSGQAFIILRNAAAAGRIVQELADECFLFPNGRPLVGSFAPPLNFPGKLKQPAFPGHLTIENFKHHTKEKEAVSTSHCSQPNTVEYEMAMEWFLLQKRTDVCWERFYKQQGEELRKVQSNLKMK